MKRSFPAWLMLGCCLLPMSALAQKHTWRKATDAELSAVLPLRAPVEKEHIETEMRTASGITDGEGHFIAGVVLITAGYSADGKYSHYLLVQAPMRIGEVALKPGQYIFGWERDGDNIRIHLHEAVSGKLLGYVEAHHMPPGTRVESLRIWQPEPGNKALLQIGRFAVEITLPGA
jgi:hypothetical protein